MRPISVLVVDDHPLVRAGFRSILSGEDDIDVVGDAKDGAEAVAAAVREIPDMVLMDIRMPGMDGLEATRLITAHPRLRGTKVIVLTTFDLDEYVFGALKAGASAFLLKGVEPPALIDAVRTVAGGDALLEPSATRRLIEAYIGGQQAAPPAGFPLSFIAHRSGGRDTPAHRRGPDEHRDRRASFHQPADLQIACIAHPDEAGRQGPHPASRPRLRERSDCFPDKPMAFPEFLREADRKSEDGGMVRPVPHHDRDAGGPADVLAAKATCGGREPLFGPDRLLIVAVPSLYAAQYDYIEYAWSADSVIL